MDNNNDKKKFRFGFLCPFMFPSQQYLTSTLRQQTLTREYGTSERNLQTSGMTGEKTQVRRERVTSSWSWKMNKDESIN